MKSILKNSLLLGLMIAASGLAVAMRPTQKIADQVPKLALETMIPLAFGEWREEPKDLSVIVDPRQRETIERIYTETLSRTYINGNGYRIMLAIAYGTDQRDSLSLHYPEVCYPAQGFQVLSNSTANLNLGGNTLRTRRLETRLGSSRLEPITYWTMIGTIPTLGSVDKKLAEMSYSFRGQIPDGLLFRVSSIDDNSSRAFQIQAQFLQEIAQAIQPENRPRLIGEHRP